MSGWRLMAGAGRHAARRQAQQAAAGRQWQAGCFWAAWAGVVAGRHSRQAGSQKCKMPSMAYIGRETLGRNHGRHTNVEIEERECKNSEEVSICACPTAHCLEPPSAGNGFSLLLFLPHLFLPSSSSLPSTEKCPTQGRCGRWCGQMAGKKKGICLSCPRSHFQAGMCAGAH